MCGLRGLHVMSCHIDWECDVRSCVAEEMQLPNTLSIRLRYCSRGIHISEELGAMIHWYVAGVIGCHVTVLKNALGIGSLMNKYTCGGI